MILRKPKNAAGAACAIGAIGGSSTASATSTAAATSAATTKPTAWPRRQLSCSTKFILLLPLIFVVQYITFPRHVDDASSFNHQQHVGDVASFTRSIEEGAAAHSQSRQHGGRRGRNCSNGVHWRILLTGNMGYEDDLLNWYHFCARAGLCPSDPSQQEEHRLTQQQQQQQQQQVDDGVSCEQQEPKFSQIVLYAEDVPLYEKYKSSKLITVKKAWDVGSKYNSTTITGDGRFSYSDRVRFRHMMSRRPSILLKELQLAQREEHGGEEGGVQKEVKILFMDLDTVILKDPRPYFVGDYDFWAADAMNDWSGPYNAGMLAMKPTDISIDCVRRWRAFLEKQEKAKANQKTFNNIVRRMNTTIAHKMLSRGEFPVGKVLLEIGYDSLNEHTLEAGTVVLHNNYCEKECSKSDRLKRLGLWTDTNAVDLHIG
eukprot:CAMPEP_0119560188 /NCGR_PEP_ID=MMETSP1352-20130426/14186_1 /TAXON_ID=265584 /ORGANISM="Stauroneis constricta, Strain CCMP1120" /LENGTH=428 /DNA_ID=CAMNT_0007608113 /DNA_START=63 /DNA_END=1349 /DNA_ORIENTATION=+